MLSKVKPLTSKEIDEVASFNSAASWGKPRVTTKTAGMAPPPGAGKVLFKVDGRPGISVQMLRTAAQSSLHIADERLREQARTTEARRSI